MSSFADVRVHDSVEGSRSHGFADIVSDPLYVAISDSIRVQNCTESRSQRGRHPVQRQLQFSMLVLIVYCLFLCAGDVYNEGEYPFTAVARSSVLSDFDPFRCCSRGRVLCKFAVFCL
ncbi:uncharacterized protein SCHCODRAFT_01347807 [Schizophyllum commune H4-8]|uniref:uncharacterized protein n=1 Tax=Schizophyllum commune (strain H4-8 / FGSC 9210) TaxID=578458 RepID=UPI00215EF19E|nr:uncharacterized protein SCHCODRAFT_01347807 [Schizophyllum commune H4-8]KAI5894580.1 hypothetical protein SCHCODRAFT_01347807 [Schizophyllum commune H4-8]